MAYDDEKKERKKIKEKLRNKNEERTKYDRYRTELKNKNAILNEEKIKYEIIRDQSSVARDYLSNANSKIGQAEGSYKRNYSGSDLNKNISTFEGFDSEITSICRDLSDINGEALKQISKITTEISENTRLIGQYNTKIASLDREIKSLKNKL